MDALKVLRYPDPRLQQVSKPVPEVTDELRHFAQQMLHTMYTHKGIGLSAPQVDRPIRYLCTDTRLPKVNPNTDSKPRYEPSKLTELEKNIPQPLHLFNPVITKSLGSTEFREGCLSLPNYFEVVQRCNYIELEALDLQGHPVQLKTDGLLAICIQHEIDHLDGKLFIDRLSFMKASLLKSKIQKYGYEKR